MRISLISDVGAINTNYRAYQPAQELARLGHEVEWNRPDEPRLNLPRLLRSDAVLIHRYADDELQGAMRRLRDAGVGLVWDNDDDISAIPRSNPIYRRFGGMNGRKMAQQVARVLRLADVATTPSAELGRRFATAGAADVRVLENYLPREFMKAKPRKHDGVAVVWVAALEHQADYQELRLRETFERLLDAHADLRLYTIGLNLGIRSPRYEQIRHVPFLELVDALSAMDIGIAPLADNPWNTARSNVKLKEYGAAGLPWLASPVGPYLGLGEQEGGRLVADGDWERALSALVADARQRKKLSKRARKWAQGQGVDRHARLWEQAFADAAEAARRRSATVAA